MRILAITNLYPRPGRERMAAFNRRQFRALAQRHELRVVAPVAWPEVVRDRARGTMAPRHYINSDGIEVDHPVYYYLPRVLPHHSGEFYLRSVRPTVDRILNEFQPEAILACWAHPDGWAAVEVARRAGLPVVIKVIGTDILIQARHARRRRRIAQAVCQADAVVAVSRDLADHVERLGAEPRRVHVVPEGTDREIFSPGDRASARRRLGLASDRPIVLFVGNLLESKGAAVLIEACALLRNRVADFVRSPGGPDAAARTLTSSATSAADFQCYLVGSGRDERKLRLLIDRRRLGAFVKLAGPCPQDGLPDWYRASDVVALPSYSEGMPNVLREALECGRPFVATRVGGIPEIAHPSYSRLVDSGDPAALAVALAEMLRSPPVVGPSLVRDVNISCEQSSDQIADVLLAAIGDRRAISGVAELV